MKPTSQLESDTLPLLSLSGVSRHFQVGQETLKVLDDITLTIQAGEMVAIMGASGSGKSTLMNILGCLDKPTCGQYRVDGLDVQQLDNDGRAQRRRERFGFIFQRYHLIPSLSVLGNVEVPACYARHPRAVRQSNAQQLLAQLGLANFAGRDVTRLSGGQQQRVSIARALMNGGDIILADEPTGALDSQNGHEVMQLLQSLNRQGYTIVIITHDAQVAHYAQRIIHLSDGKILSDQPNQGGKKAEGDHAPSPHTSLNVGKTPVAHSPWRVRWEGANDILKNAWNTLCAHRLRSSLTLLGIVIGIVSVVLLNAAGEGAKKYVLNNLSALGGNILTLYPGKGFGDDQAAGIRSLRPRDLVALEALPGVTDVTPNVSSALRIRWQRADTNATVSGGSAGFLKIKNLKLIAGRGLLPRDVERQSSVVVIDENLRNKLFPPATEPLGKIIMVGPVPCRIVGVARSLSSFGDNSLNAWMPWSTVTSRLQGQTWFSSIAVSLDNQTPIVTAKEAIQIRLKRLHGQQDFFILDSADFVRTIENTGFALTLFLLVIALISLLVGGIGVMNIMLVSVTERTRETGIRMAVGARQRDIQRQFLAEAILLCLAGAMIGVVLSLGIGTVASLFIQRWQMVFSVQAILIAVLSSVVVGILSGWLPARQAARLDPAEALTRE
ncbi:MacB family efflux pump subunit [Pseudomonas graminis]